MVAPELEGAFLTQLYEEPLSSPTYATFLFHSELNGISIDEENKDGNGGSGTQHLRYFCMKIYGGGQQKRVKVGLKVCFKT